MFVTQRSSRHSGRETKGQAPTRIPYPGSQVHEFALNRTDAIPSSSWLTLWLFAPSQLASQPRVHTRENVPTQTPHSFIGGKQTYHTSFPTGIHVSPPSNRGQKAGWVGQTRVRPEARLILKNPIQRYRYSVCKQGRRREHRVRPNPYLPPEKHPFICPSTGSNPTITFMSSRARSCAPPPRVVTQDRDLDLESKPLPSASLGTLVLPPAQAPGIRVQERHDGRTGVLPS